MNKTIKPVPVTEEDYLAACEDNTGWCTDCKEFCVAFAEPDAKEYECQNCLNNTGFGAAQALIEMLITIQ